MPHKLSVSDVFRFHFRSKLIRTMSQELHEKFCLKWNDFETNINSSFRELKNDEDFFDVTIAFDDSQIKSHKVILSACSPFFKAVLKKNPHPHPVLYLKGVKYEEFLLLLNFMYNGEVNVAQEELNSFLAVAEDLKVKGLFQDKNSLSNNKESFKTSERHLSNEKSSKMTNIEGCNRQSNYFEEKTEIVQKLKTEGPILLDCEEDTAITKMEETDNYQDEENAYLFDPNYQDQSLAYQAGDEGLLQNQNQGMSNFFSQ